MTDNMTPQLTLDPTAAAAEAVPTLTLTPEAPEAPQVEEEKKIEPVEMDDKLLTDAEKKAVEDFSHKIDIRDTNMILQYGAAAQKSVASFSENALNNVRSKDMGEIGEDLSRLVVELKGFGEEEEKKGLAGLFRRTGNRLETMKAQYGKVEANVDKIAQSLEQHQITLLKDVAMFDQMYELNLKYYKELTMYILAGKKRLAEVRSTELEELRKKAEQTGLAEDAQAYNDLVNLCNRFEKKLHDLELTRMVSVQMGPQTRLLQNNDTQMIEKIQSSLVNTIPLWKSQMVLALGMVFATSAVRNSLMSYTGYFAVIAAIMLVALVIFMLTVREKEWAYEMQQQAVALGIEEETQEQEEAEGGRKLSVDEVRSLILLLLSIVLWFFGYNAVTSKYSVYASNILHKDYNLTLIIAQAAAIVSYLPVGFIASKAGRKKTILAGVVMLTTAFTVAAFLNAESPTMLMNAMFALAGIAWATINVNSFPMVVEMCSGGDVGKYTGFYYTASMAAQVATPMLSGLLMDRFGMHVLFPYAAVFTALAFVTMLFVKHGDSREAPKQTAAAGTEDAGAIDNTVEELTND